MNRSFIISSILFSLLLLLLIFREINLTTADIGRHLINGKLLLGVENFTSLKYSLLHTNFFSFTYPNFPFINHHWGSGIIFYIIFTYFGFNGLSIFYGSLLIFSSIFLFYIFQKKIPIFISFPIMLFVIPLIAERTEVRPEVFGYLFISIVIIILYLYNSNNINRKWLYCIPIITLILVNTHIYFIMIPFIIGMFLLEKLLRKDYIKSKILAILLVTSTLIMMINPYGFDAIIYPFIIFKNYGYLIAENQSIVFLMRLGIENPNFLWWLLSTSILIIFSIITLKKYPGKFPIALFGIAYIFSILSFLGIRHLTLYGLVLIPIFLNFAFILYDKSDDPKRIYTHESRSILISIIIFILILFNFNKNLPWNSNFGVGLMPSINASAEFVKKEKISGPIFSNYDIGSYLIFHFYPSEKVFVDNRPEGYPIDFFKNEYIPMQENESIWNKELIKRNFNIIYFYRKDMTPWAQPFLINRLNDQSWSPIFVDDYVIIFIRRNDTNNDIISKYELPKNIFSITK
ncbi:MAG: hypothetical protein WCW65_01755 [Candidatus Paceibacterota bacterium]